MQPTDAQASQTTSAICPNVINGSRRQRGHSLHWLPKFPLGYMQPVRDEEVQYVDTIEEEQRTTRERWSSPAIQLRAAFVISPLPPTR